MIYIFAGKLYWLLNEKDGSFGRVAPSPEYPREIADTWQGVPASVDAAFTGLNGELVSSLRPTQRATMRGRPVGRIGKATFTQLPIEWATKIDDLDSLY
ncbi:unnamed protein product [Protopolystoma xenopodis]|uniref:Uncharacterized protein n=1 Tax=Protopolystoma xenopodis TaxID=117903 RepID=A0A3S5CH99_9PLAT|nr:unnamed protein product [Protopolystoma xenopodis]